MSPRCSARSPKARPVTRSGTSTSSPKSATRHRRCRSERPTRQPASRRSPARPTSTPRCISRRHYAATATKASKRSPGGLETLWREPRRVAPAASSPASSRFPDLSALTIATSPGSAPPRGRSVSRKVAVDGPAPLATRSRWRRYDAKSPRRAGRDRTFRYLWQRLPRLRQALPELPAHRCSTMVDGRGRAHEHAGELTDRPAQACRRRVLPVQALLTSSARADAGPSSRSGVIELSRS